MIVIVVVVVGSSGLVSRDLSTARLCLAYIYTVGRKRSVFIWNAGEAGEKKSFSGFMRFVSVCVFVPV